MLRFTEKAVLDVLKHGTWMTSPEIIQKIGALRTGYLYVILAELERKNVVEWRYQVQSQQEKKRNDFVDANGD